MTSLAPWRVLGIDKCGSLRSPKPSTRHEKENKNNTENQTESAAEKAATDPMPDPHNSMRTRLLSFLIDLYPNFSN